MGGIELSKYACVCISQKLAKLIDEKRESFGYSSRADFVKQACRRELEKLRGVAK